MESVKEKYNYIFKIISMILIICIFLEILMPLKSFAETSLQILFEGEGSNLQVGNIVYAKLYVTGDKINGITGYLNYDETIFKTVKKANI